MKEYKTAKGLAIFVYIVAPIMLLVFLAILVLPFFDDETPIELLYFMGPLSIGMIGIMVVGILDTKYGKVIISDDTISLRSTLVNRDLKFEEIEGFRYDTRYIYILPNTPDKKRIKISTSSIQTDELLSWLADNFKDLDWEDARKEQQDILQNKAFGIDANERTANLQQAKTITTILNWISVLFFCWTLFYPTPYELVVITLIAIPIFSLFTVIRFKGLIKLDTKNESPYPSIIIPLGLSSFGLLLRGLMDFENIYAYSNIWLPTILVAAALTLPILITQKGINLKAYKNIFSVLILFLFIGMAYGYGTTIITNCYYDDSIPTQYTAEIVSKRIDKGKYTTYHFELTPWSNRTEAEEVTVSENLYEKMTTGDSVKVYLKEGRFNIPWFMVYEE